MARYPARDLTAHLARHRAEIWGSAGVGPPNGPLPDPSWTDVYSASGDPGPGEQWGCRARTGSHRTAASRRVPSSVSPRSRSRPAGVFSAAGPCGWGTSSTTERSRTSETGSTPASPEYGIHPTPSSCTDFSRDQPWARYGEAAATGSPADESAALRPSVVVPTGIEPVASSVSRKRSPTELRDRWWRRLRWLA
jgi:hypothetical protein